MTTTLLVAFAISVPLEASATCSAAPIFATRETLLQVAASVAGLATIIATVLAAAAVPGARGAAARLRGGHGRQGCLLRSSCDTASATCDPATAARGVRRCPRSAEPGPNGQRRTATGRRCPAGRAAGWSGPRRGTCRPAPGRSPRVDATRGSCA